MNFARKIILPYVLSYRCKLDTNLACGKKQCKDDDYKEETFECKLEMNIAIAWN